MRVVLRVLLRQLAADRWAALLVLLLVAGTAGLCAGAVRAVDAVAVTALQRAVEQAGPSARALTGVIEGPPPSGPSSAPEQPYTDLAAEVLEGPGRDLPGLVDPPGWSVTTPVFTLTPPPRPGPLRRLQVRVATGWQQRTTLRAGRLPRAGSAAEPAAAQRIPGGPVRRPARVEVVVSAVAADLMRLKVGDRLQAAPDNPSAVPPGELLLVGLVEPKDPADPFWELDPSALRPRLVQSPNGPDTRVGIAFAGTAALPAIADQLAAASATLQVRMTLRAGPLAHRDPVSTVAALRRATTRLVPAGTSPAGGPVSLGMTTTAPRVLVTHLARRAPVLALVAVLLAALLGAAAVTLVLAARLLVDRRRQAVALAAARGGSARQVLGLLAAEGALLGAPAAAAGYAAAALVPGRPGIGPWLVAAVALAPVLVLPGTTWPVLRAVGGSAVARSPRRDAVLRRTRAAGVLLLTGLAVAAVLTLRRRGLDTGDAAAPGGVDPSTGVGGGADPLVVLVPVLVGATLAVLVARMVGRPLAAAARRAGRRRGAIGFLGLARAAREGSLGPLALAALVLGLSTAVLAAVTGSTLATATREAAQRQVAADLQLGSPGFDPAAAAALARLPGVRLATEWYDAGDVPFGTPDDPAATDTAVLVAGDAAALDRVQRSLPGAGRWPRQLLGFSAAGLRPGSTVRLPAVVGPGTAAVGDQILVRVGGRTVDATVAAVRPAFPGAPQTGRWVFLPLAGVRALTGLTLASTALLVDVDGPPGRPARLPDRATVEAALGEGAVTAYRTPDSVAGELGRSPLVAAVRGGLPVALGVGGLYAGLAVLLTVLVGSRDRGRFLAHLRALGLSPGQSGSLVGLEVVPVVTVALLVGVLGGIGTALLVLPVADLRPLSGAELAVPVHLAARPLAAVCAGFAAVLGVAVLAAVTAGRRVSPAAAARAGD
jgi:putative ABC transport system permease protein